jgi:RimJ/RimL family protein N-acetyltransferase
VIARDAFRDQPTLSGELVRLEPLGPAVLDGYVQLLADPEGRRMTGTHEEFTLESIERWLASRAAQHDRADWAAHDARSGEFVGEVVLHDFEPDNESVGFRIALAGPQFFGRGYGTEMTRLALGYALDVVGLHRVELEVYEHNPRARRVHEKCGFVLEGRRRDALLWDGERYDALAMAVLRSDSWPWSPGG